MQSDKRIRLNKDEEDKILLLQYKIDKFDKSILCFPDLEKNVKNLGAEFDKIKNQSENYSTKINKIETEVANLLTILNGINTHIITINNFQSTINTTIANELKNIIASKKNQFLTDLHTSKITSVNDLLKNYDFSKHFDISAAVLKETKEIENNLIKGLVKNSDFTKIVEDKSKTYLKNEIVENLVKNPKLISLIDSKTPNITKIVEDKNFKKKYEDKIKSVIAENEKIKKITTLENGLTKLQNRVDDKVKAINGEIALINSSKKL